MKHRVPLALAALALFLVTGGNALAKSSRVSGFGQDGKHVIVIDDSDGAYLGVSLSDLDADERGDDGGVRVQSVFDGTPAREAGLEAGDVILEFDGEKIADAAQLTKLVREHDPGDTIKVKARRDGDSKTFRVTLGEREQSFTLDGRGGWSPMTFGDDVRWSPELSWGGAARLGVEVRDLDPDLGEYFPGAKRGALVLSVDEDSPAAEAGLKAGDVITKLGDESVDGVDALREAVRDLAGEDASALVFVRKGKTKSVDVEIPAPRRAAFMRQFNDDGPFGRSFRMLHPDGDDGLQSKLDALEQRLEELEQRLRNSDDSQRGR